MQYIAQINVAFPQCKIVEHGPFDTLEACQQFIKTKLTEMHGDTYEQDGRQYAPREWSQYWMAKVKDKPNPAEVRAARIQEIQQQMATLQAELDGLKAQEE